MSASEMGHAGSADACGCSVSARGDGVNARESAAWKSIFCERRPAPFGKFAQDARRVVHRRGAPILPLRDTRTFYTHHLAAISNAVVMADASTVTQFTNELAFKLSIGLPF